MAKLPAYHAMIIVMGVQALSNQTAKGVKMGFTDFSILVVIALQTKNLSMGIASL